MFTGIKDLDRYILLFLDDLELYRIRYPPINKYITLLTNDEFWFKKVDHRVFEVTKEVQYYEEYFKAICKVKKTGFNFKFGNPSYICIILRRYRNWINVSIIRSYIIYICPGIMIYFY